MISNSLPPIANFDKTLTSYCEKGFKYKNQP